MRTAPAKVPIHLLDDRVAGGVRLLLEQGPGVHDHARRAVAALESAMLHEGLLQRVQLSVAFEAFDRHDVLPLHAGEVDLTGAHRLAVDADGARAADAFTAAVFRAGEIEIAAEDPE